MSVNPFISVGDVLKRRFGHTSNHINSLKEVEQILNTSLPSHMRMHVAVVNVRENILTLYTVSPEWSTQIRFQIPNILSEFRKSSKFNHISKIKLKIRPSSTHG